MESEERNTNKVYRKLVKMVHNFEATITSALKGNIIPKLLDYDIIVDIDSIFKLKIG